MEAQVPHDGAKAFAAMDVQKVEMGTSVPDKQVQQEAEQPKAEKIPTPKDMNPPIVINVKVACDEVIKEGSVIIEKKEAEVEINFMRHTVTVFDSYIAFTSNSKLGKYLKPISNTLVWVLYNMRFYDASEVEESLLHFSSISFVQLVSQVSRHLAINIVFALPLICCLRQILEIVI
ncbi:unnamed protein product, partial [Prunus brigantina]